MALIKCPECNKKISDSSESCICCGYPINKRIDKASFSKESIQTTQQTGKGLKFVKLIGILFLAFGLIGVITSPDSNTENNILFLHLSITFIGIILFYFARFMIWWEHK